MNNQQKEEPLAAMRRMIDANMALLRIVQVVIVLLALAAIGSFIYAAWTGQLGTSDLADWYPI